MIKTKFNTLAARSIKAGFVVGALMAAQGAFACTVDNWSAESGNPLASGPDGPDGKSAIARYSGLCAMQVADGAVSFVEDLNPGGIDRIRARFYVLADNTDTAVVYEGLNSTTPVFTIEVDGAGVFSVSGDGLSQQMSASGVAGNWNSVELDWDAGAGQVSLWVNSDAGSETADASESLSSGQVVTSVRLGNLNGAAGTMNFDAYESRRTTEIARLLRGDANDDGAVNSGDFTAVVNDFLGVSLATGQPDCNEDGAVNSGDFTCVVNLFLGL
ncbi:MAG: hypothetical protein KGY49_03760 [Wenzhouxiangellaceae bacterium]|nr:hypothetical protein [Wenzhouxiangellaceae bacterium]